MFGTARIALLLASLAVIGCGPTLGVRARLASRTRGLHRCYGLRVLQLTENAFEVTGCGATFEYTDIAEGHGRVFELMRPAAALARAELQCDYATLRIVGERAPTRRSFAGCGASANYVLACRPVGGCSWAREGEVIVETATPAEPVSLDTRVPPPPTESVPPAPDSVVPPQVGVPSP